MPRLAVIMAMVLCVSAFADQTWTTHDEAIVLKLQQAALEAGLYYGRCCEVRAADGGGYAVTILSAWQNAPTQAQLEAIPVPQEYPRPEVIVPVLRRGRPTGATATLYLDADAGEPKAVTNSASPRRPWSMQAIDASNNTASARFDRDDLLKAVITELVVMCNSNRAVIRKAHGISAANFPNVTEASFKAAVKARLP